VGRCSEIFFDMLTNLILKGLQKSEPNQ